MLITMVAAGVGIFLIVLMTCIYRYGNRAIPDNALVPVHAGPGGWDHWRPKKRGLLAWPIIGAVISAILVGAVALIQQAGNADGHHRGAAAAAITIAGWAIVVTVLPLSQYRAIQAALNRAKKS